MFAGSGRQAVAGLMLAGGLLVAPDAGQAGQGIAPPVAAFADSSVVVEARSRGQGIPPDSFEALMQVREWVLEAHLGGGLLAVRDEVVGIEGEVRLCLRVNSAERAAEALSALSRIVEGRELLLVAAGGCPGDPAAPVPSQ